MKTNLHVATAARFGIDPSVQYSANQPDYDLKTS
jgi:hypothetical protein